MLRTSRNLGYVEILPDAPVLPGNPEAPVAPEKPLGPVEPVAPVLPIGPGEPAEKHSQNTELLQQLGNILHIAS